MDAARTSPYKFYQFWLNTSDADADKFIRIFTTWSQGEVEALIAQHTATPHLRIVQKKLAEEITRRTHGEEELQSAIQASEVLFGKGDADALGKLSDQQWLDVFDGVPQAEVPRDHFATGMNIIDLSRITRDSSHPKGKRNAP